MTGSKAKTSPKSPKQSSAINKLSEWAKKGQPVFLYGEGNINRTDLIQYVHTDNGGKVKAVEYVDGKNKPNENVFIKNVTDEVNKCLVATSNILQFDPDSNKRKDESNKKYNEITNKVRSNFRSTKRSWMRRDCKGMNSKEVYENMIVGDLWPRIEIPIQLSEYKNKVFPVEFSGSYLLDFKGTLFLDNLHCRNDLDNKYYEKLAKIIKEKQMKKYDPILEGYYEDTKKLPRKVSVNWLVVYAKDYKSFPQEFYDQFEWVPLTDDTQIKTKKKKLRGIKGHYIVKEERDKLLKEIIKAYPRRSNVFVAGKVMMEIQKKYGTKPNGKPFYTEKTLAKEVSKFKNKKKRRETTR